MISRLIAALALLSAAAAIAHGRAASREPQAPIDRERTSAPRSSRTTTSYTIAATIDPTTRRIDGRERIRWRNATTRPAGELQFHLYYNAVPAGSISVTSLRDAAGDRDLLAASTMSSVSADVPARSLLRVPLGEAVEPGGELALDVRWTATMPSDALSGSVALAAHWFPQLAVLTDTGWTSHQDPRRSYVFADAGTFDATIEAPAGWDVAATGREVRPSDGARGRRFVQSDASDFAFAAGRTWIERRTRVERPDGDPIAVRLLLQPEHAAQIDRVEAGVTSALGRADVAAASYPYGDLTILDLPWRSPAAGEVFPAFVTLTTRWLEPGRVTELETALARALARHSWQHVVIADAVANPWMVDGLTAYAATRLLERLVQRQLDSTNPDGFLVARFFGGFVPYAIRSIRTNQALDGGDATIRAARAMQTLERYVGWPTFETIMSEYARQFRFAHPEPDDFVRVAETVSGRDLRWFFDQAFAADRSFDYAVQQVTSETLGSARHRTTVTVARAGDAIFSGSSRPPIPGYQSGRAMEIAIAFGDGTLQHETWDGRDRSTTFAYESAAPLASVAIDPDRILALDTRRTNNSWAARPTGQAAATRWSAYWMLWLEHVLVTYGMLV
jgi:hypothetical protein